MTQYEQQNAAWKVDGYYQPTPSRNDAASFELAKAECLKHLHRQIECIQSLTLEQFLYEKKRDFS